MSVYLDNAATTSLRPEVFDVMEPFLKNLYGNPSSQHAAGREVRSAIETARKSLAQLIHAQAGDIVFTSGGTEANNMIIKGAVRDLGVKHIITSPMEHHGVLHPIEYVQSQDEVKITVVPIDQNGLVKMDELEKALSSSTEKTLVSIMHANNEIGSMIDLDRVAQLCETYGALFHSDTVQTFAHYQFDVQKTPIDFMSVAAHKFHGPKGVGFMYMRKSSKLHSFIHGGSQERGYRAGTENVPGIIGMAKAAELAYEHFEQDKQYILGLRKYLIEEIKKVLPGVEFNGTLDEERCLYTVLSLSLPPHQAGGLLLFQLDMKGIYVSGSSACSSGASLGSHVIASLGKNADRVPLRVSFSRYTTTEELDALVSELQELYDNQQGLAFS